MSKGITVAAVACRWGYYGLEGSGLWVSCAGAGAGVVCQLKLKTCC